MKSYFIKLVLALFCVFVYIFLPLLAPNSDQFNNSIVACDSLGETFFLISPLDTLIGWGIDEHGLFGSETRVKFRPYWMRKNIIDNVVAFDCGYKCLMAVKTDNSLWAWGKNSTLFLGKQSASTDGPVKIMNDVVSVGIGAFHAAAIRSNGSLWTWGYNRNGELGVGSVSEVYHDPSEVLKNIASVYLTSDSTFAITKDNKLYGWGAIETVNGYPTTVPTLIGTDVKSINSIGIESLLQILSIDNKVYAYNVTDEDYGYLGDGTEVIAEDVRSVCSGGVILEDNSYCVWGLENASLKLKPMRDNIAAAESEQMMISKNGRVFANALFVSPISLKSMFTIDPIMQITYIFVTSMVLVIIFNRYNKKER